MSISLVLHECSRNKCYKTRFNSALGMDWDGLCGLTADINYALYLDHSQRLATVDLVAPAWECIKKGERDLL